MRKRIGTKLYDTDKAVLVDTLQEGVQVYMKKGFRQDFFLYNPSASNKHEMFIDLPKEQSEKYLKYLPEEKTGSIAHGSNNIVRFSPDNRNRIKRLASARGMSMASFLIMLVDEYEKNNPA